MRSIVSTIKTLWHRDLVSDPVTHAWVLNLYRAGEHHHQTVDDYFPVAHAPSADLAESLRRHEHDEVRHDRMYTHAIRRLGEPVLAAAPSNVFNHVIRRFTPVVFKVEDSDSLETRRRKVAHFLAHAHFLEKRIARSLIFHVEACEHARRSDMGAVVSAVQQDEARHVNYTREGASDLLSRREAEEVFAIHERAESRANLAFSREQVERYLRLFPDASDRRRRLLYRLCAWIMEEASHV